MKQSATKNLQMGYGLSLLLLLVSSVASYISIQNLLDSSKWVNHTNRVISQLEQTISTLKDAETGQRGYLLTGLEEFLEPYNNAYQKAETSIQAVKDLTEDNAKQQKNCQELRTVVLKRIERLDKVIHEKKKKGQIDIKDMLDGKVKMDLARKVIDKMIDEENRLLQIRTAKMNQFALYTPFLILLAAIMSVIITLISYLRAKKDFEKRAELYAELQTKDEETSKRIAIIEGIADKVSKGNYTTRIEDGQEKDKLGNLAISLNKMAESLNISFIALRDKEWLQTGIAGLNETMVGEKDVNILTANILEYIISYTNSQVGAFYLTQDEEYLILSSSYALKSNVNKRIALGEGIIGQSALNKKEINLIQVDDKHITVSYASGEARPGNIFVLPVKHENNVIGVIEIASFNNYTERDQEYFKSIENNIGIAINAAQNRHKLQQLLEETQAQSEELQAQHSELENLNTELEAQAQKLQASEEELKVQQEELLEANQTLQERSKALEERNQLIVERNLDIQKKAEELELSTKYKSEFLANMSHELRTPLNSILLLSRLLSENTETNLTEDQIEYAKVIQNSGNGLLALIDEILDLSKIEAGKMDMDFVETPVKEIIYDMQSLFLPIAKQKNLEFKIESGESIPTTLVTDKLRLEQILKNLISNALKFTNKGFVAVAITSSNDNSLITFKVKDSGIGISQDKHQHVFEAFQQEDGSTRRKFGGTGLGLSISRELAKLLGGEITLHSEPNKGSEFSLTIPVYHIDLKIIPPVTPKKVAPVSITEVKPAVEDIPKNFVVDNTPQPIPDDRDNLKEGEKPVLIVEDDTNFAKALLDFTRKSGYKGIVAVRGDLGIEMATKYKPAAILLDIQLPVKDGWEVMEQLKSNSLTRHIPVHIMSALEAKKESLIKGAVDFINKPVALEQMKSMFTKLEDALNRHPKKVLIIEENTKHAQALSYFLSSFNVSSEIKGSVSDGISALQESNLDCIILDMGIPDQNAYETLEAIKTKQGLENLPIIIFTGKNLSKAEESRLKQYADSIVMKTAHSYQRILDEVALFLHLVEEKSSKEKEPARKKNLIELNEVLKGKTVLIADDDVRNIFSLTKALEQMQMNVLSATDGKEALRILDENPNTDVVLMDMMMPEMDGYESTAQIRKNYKYKNLPILAVTAKAMIGDREKCIKAGASDYISKPVDIDQLISLLRVWLYDKHY